MLPENVRLKKLVYANHSCNNSGNFGDFGFGTSYNPPVKRKVKIESESRHTESAILRIDLSLQPRDGLFGFSTNLSLRRTLNLNVTFIRYAPF
jgi:hypothetical protein